MSFSVQQRFLWMIGAICLASTAVAEEPVMGFTEALSNTYTYNPELSAAREQLKAVDERMNQAFSGFRPSLSAEYSRGNERVSVNDQDYNYGTTDSRGASISQSLFSGFGSYYQYKEAIDTVMAQRENLKSTEQSILLNAATAYADVIRTRRVLDLSKKNEEVLKKHLEATKERFDVGEVTRTDVAQAESRLASAVANRAQSEADAVAALSLFERVVRRPAGESMSDELPNLSLPPTLDEAVDIAIKQNPVLKQRKHQADAAENNVGEQRAGLLPEVTLVGSAERSDGLTSFGQQEVRNDSVVLNVSIPLYDSGLSYSLTRQAKRESAQSKLTALDTHNRVREAVASAWERLFSARASIDATKEAVEAAKVALDGVRQEQMYGARTTLDVLDAERELFQTEVDLVSAERSEAVAEYTLASLLGQFTAQVLSLPVQMHDPEEYYKNNSHKILGF